MNKKYYYIESNIYNKDNYLILLIIILFNYLYVNYFI
jgi:hypothetical protein